MKNPGCLIIMDGYGLGKPGVGNAIVKANKPHLDSYFEENVTVMLQASGESVGLPAGQMGNSEVGHLNIGAGRIVDQELTRINKACKTREINNNEIILEACKRAKENDGVLHMMGLISDGGVHSSNEHLFALIDLAIMQDVPKIFIHCFMDGRDVPPTSGAQYLAQLEAVIKRKNENAEKSGKTARAEIASVQGRYYVMDRDNRWDRVEKGYQCIVNAQPCDDGLSAVDVCENSYKNDVTDEFIVPIAINPRGMKDGDSVIFINFRPDRARQITRALTVDGFDGFDVSDKPNLYYVCMTEYDESFTCPVAFPKSFPKNVLADVLADAGLVQYHTAETEKYAHVTFFLNGGKEEPKKNEIRKLINSPKIATYDLQPEMSAPLVAQSLSQAIENDEADIYIVNFANCDMVGHTGVMEAAVAAVEAVDAGVAQVVEAMKEKNGFVLITADHGNADLMLDDNGNVVTKHTTNPVPFTLIDFTGQNRQLTGQNGALCDIAPTLLKLIDVAPSAEMTGKALV